MGKIIWYERCLADLTTVISRGVTPKYTESKENSAIVLNQRCIREGKVLFDVARLNDLDKRSITEQKALKSYDVLVNSTGVGTLGRVSQIEEVNEIITVDSHVTIVRADKNIIDPIYMGYALKAQQKYIENLGEGSTGQTELSRIRLGNEIFVRFPEELTIQEKIASILKSLDDKIELNNQMNQTLEEMAQCIFKEWFVEFNFPNEEGVPYKDNGGEMVESELGEIPKGWRIEELGKLLYIQNGYAFKSKELLDEGITKIIKIKNISKNNIAISLDGCQFISKETKLKTNDKFRISLGDILIAMTGAEVGKLGIIPDTKEEFYLNQRVGKLIEKLNGGNYFGYNFFSKREVQELLFAKAQGSAQPNISSKGLEEMVTAVPDENTLALYANKVQGIYEKIIKNLGENMTLVETRDILLPKLMSGEIRV